MSSSFRRRLRARRAFALSTSSCRFVGPVVKLGKFGVDQAWPHSSFDADFWCSRFGSDVVAPRISTYSSAVRPTGCDALLCDLPVHDPRGNLLVSGSHLRRARCREDVFLHDLPVRKSEIRRPVILKLDQLFVDHLVPESLLEVQGRIIPRCMLPSVPDVFESWSEFAWNPDAAVFKSGLVLRGRAADLVPIVSECHETVDLDELDADSVVAVNVSRVVSEVLVFPAEHLEQGAGKEAKRLLHECECRSVESVGLLSVDTHDDPDLCFIADGVDFLEVVGAPVQLCTIDSDVRSRAFGLLLAGWADFAGYLRLRSDFLQNPEDGAGFFGGLSCGLPGCSAESAADFSQLQRGQHILAGGDAYADLVNDLAVLFCVRDVSGAHSKSEVVDEGVVRACLDVHDFCPAAAVFLPCIDEDFCDDPVPISVVEGVAHAVVAGSAVAIAGVARQRMLDAHATGEYFGKQLVNIQHLVSRVHKAASGDFREKAQLIADISNNVGAECVAVVRNFQEWQGPEFSDILRVRGNWCLAVQLGLVLAGAALELVAAFGEDVVTVQRNGYSDVGLISCKLKQAIMEDWLDEDIKEWLLEFFGRRGLETSIVLSARACVCTGIDRQCSLCGSDCVV